MIDAYRLLSETIDHPLHLGVTEAGPPPAGLVKSTAGIGTLLAEGIGDTIRFSLTADPVEEAKAGRTLLEALGLRERKGLDLIACPSCGRAEVDVIAVANEAQAALEARNIPLQVAVMGCVVNGPGEAREADLGIAAGRGKGHLFVKGQVVRVVPEAEMVDALVDEAERDHGRGHRGRGSPPPTPTPSAIAAATREELLQIQGIDANHSTEKIAKIREIADVPRSGNAIGIAINEMVIVHARSSGTTRDRGEVPEAVAAHAVHDHVRLVADRGEEAHRRHDGHADGERPSGEAGLRGSRQRDREHHDRGRVVRHELREERGARTTPARTPTSPSPPNTSTSRRASFARETARRDGVPEAEAARRARRPRRG